MKTRSIWVVPWDGVNVVNMFWRQSSVDEAPSVRLEVQLGRRHLEALKTICA
jgi:hypothetical protein